MVAIKLTVVEEMVQQAIKALPNETCGILAGNNDGVEKIYKMANVSDKPELCYFMDSREQLKAMKEIRNSGLDMVGIYHSHPGTEAYPSSKDTELAFYPEAVYVIISLKDKNAPEIRAFRIVDGKITGEEITI